jgi:GT2 family glycosyltransferase
VRAATTRKDIAPRLHLEDDASVNGLEALRQVSVAILSCNRREELRTTLRGLLTRGSLWREIIVADNASSDGTPGMLRAEFPDVHLIETGGNSGVAGINRAYRAATGSWVLSLDDDSCPDLDSWEPLARELAANLSFAAIACSVRSKPAGRTLAGQPTIVPYLGFHQAGGLLRRDLVEKLGGFDEGLFLWGVELHLTARAVLAGFATARCDSAVVVHRATPLNRSSRRHAFYYCRNLFLLVLRHGPVETWRELIDAFLSRVLLYSALHRTTAYVGAVHDAVRLHRRTRLRAPLTREQFAAMNPDLRAPFSYLG